MTIDWDRLHFLGEMADGQGHACGDFCVAFYRRLAERLASEADTRDDGRPPLDPATKAHDDAYMAGLIRGRELEREAAEAAPLGYVEGNRDGYTQGRQDARQEFRKAIVEATLVENQNRGAVEERERILRWLDGEPAWADILRSPDTEENQT